MCFSVLLFNFLATRNHVNKRDTSAIYAASHTYLLLDQDIDFKLDGVFEPLSAFDDIVDGAFVQLYCVLKRQLGFVMKRRSDAIIGRSQSLDFIQ